MSRVVESTVSDEWAAKVKALDEEVEAILKDEKEEKLLNQTDMVIRKGENIIAHEDEIYARPRRTWFETEKEKLQAKKAGKEELNGSVGLRKAKAGGKLSNKDKKALDAKRERVEGRAWKKGRGEGNAVGHGKRKDKRKGSTKEAQRRGSVGGKGGDGRGGPRPRR